MSGSGKGSERTGRRRGVSILHGGINRREAAIILAMLIAIAVSVWVIISDYDLSIGASIIRDINVLLISTNATLIGLYVTAFIFLNDSLKTRVKEDPTLGEAVSTILSRYRSNMFVISAATIISILLEVLNNITLGGEGLPDIENWSIPISDWRCCFFMVVSVVALAITAWIVCCSQDITNSDGLIEEYSRRNLEKHEKKILEHWSKVQDAVKIMAERTDSPDRGLSSLRSDDWSKPLLEGASPEVVADLLDNLLRVDSGTGGTVLAHYLRPEHEACAEIDGISSNEELCQEMEIIFGKRVRFLETIIRKICENNIDRSIMNDEFIYDSMCSGFQWLYARQNGKPSDMPQPQDSIAAMTVDVRDEKRFLDFVKYQIITDPLFQERPFNNRAVEELFEAVAAKFRVLSPKERARGIVGSDHYTEKKERISGYKQMMHGIISEFFDGYESVVGYRDALIHFRRYSRSNDTRPARSERSLVSRNIGEITAYAELLIRVMIDRFTSFVKVSDLNLGNTTLDKGWFNYSEFSHSSFTHSSFRFARIENAIFRDCDLSTCSFVGADASGTDFTDCNFSYSNLTGMDLQGAVVDHAQMNAAVFRDPMMDRYDGFTFLFRGMPGIDKNEIDSWLERDIPDRIRGKAFGAAINEFLPDGVACLSVAEDDRDLSLWHDGIARFMEGLSGATSELITAHKLNKIPMKFFERILEARNREQKRSNGDGAKNNTYTKHNRERLFGKLSFGVANLSSISGNGVSLNNVDFSFVSMEDSSLTSSDLSNAEMYHTVAKNAMFSHTNFNELDAYESDFSNANFTEANLINGLFINCNLHEANMERAILLHALIINTLDGEGYEVAEPLYIKRFMTKRQSRDRLLHMFEVATDEELCELIDGDGNRVSRRISISSLPKHEELRAASDCVFTEVIANNITVINMNMVRSLFRGATLKDGFFANDIMRWCDFTDANLTNALIVAGSFSHSGFINANLSRARIFASEFSNVNLSGARLISTKISKSLFEECSLRGAILSSSVFENCSFCNCSFKGINVGTVIFRNCIFYGYDFRGAVGLSAAVFEDCIFRGSEDASSVEEVIAIDAPRAKESTNVYISGKNPPRHSTGISVDSE